MQKYGGTVVLKDKSVNGEGGENAGISSVSAFGTSCREKKRDRPKL